MSRRLLLSVIGIIFFVGILLILLPDIQEIPEERMASAAMAMCVVNIKKSVSDDLQKGHIIQTDYENKCPRLISKLSVSSEGNIEMFNPKYQIQLLFRPTLKEGVISWTCRGEPAKFVPKACQSIDDGSQTSNESGR